MGFELGEKIKAFDIFGEEIKFNIKGMSSSKSYVGTLLTLIVFTVTVAYTYQRGRIMMERNDTIFLTAKTLSEVTKDEPLSQQESQFNFMIGLRTYQSGKFVPIDDGYFDFVITRRLKSIKEKGAYIDFIDDIQFHSCIEDDLQYFHKNSDHPDDYLSKFDEGYKTL